MPEHDLEKLLGGFAANTLTPEERSQLYTASLQDQQLFNALADEQALKELLSDPAVRRKLLEALKRPNTAEAGGSLPWWAWVKRPAALAFARSSRPIGHDRRREAGQAVSPGSSIGRLTPIARCEITVQSESTGRTDQARTIHADDGGTIPCRQSCTRQCRAATRAR